MVEVELRNQLQGFRMVLLARDVFRVLLEVFQLEAGFFLAVVNDYLDRLLT